MLPPSNERFCYRIGEKFSGARQNEIPIPASQQSELNKFIALVTPLLQPSRRNSATCAQTKRNSFTPLRLFVQFLGR
jgi:hypothetical protein